MKIKLKRLWSNILLKIASVFGVLSGWFCKLSVKVATYAEDLNAKWFYTKAFIIGSESEISDAIRDNGKLPVKPVAVVAEGSDYYLVYDYSIHKVIELKKTRVYMTEADAFEAVKGFVSTRNSAVVVVDEAKEMESEPTYTVTTKTTLSVPVSKKGNGKRHIKHDKKDNKKQLRKGNGDFKKKPAPKKKVVKKVSK